MIKDALDNKMRELAAKDAFLLEVPIEGHALRFMEKLKKHTQDKRDAPSFWKQFGIAASFLILIGLGFSVNANQQKETDLASISPEMAQTQNFFTSTIKVELENLEKEISPFTKSLVDDALIQLENLEKEYENLKLDLAKSGNDKRVIYAMISNFQNRITLLENVLSKIEEIKQLKINKNENLL
ncbi:MAG: hypothetical protein COW66_00335 [Flavobacteriaceae bacterium CG18_big_fil_WC_8_21_14_2_50_34_36]|nr:MAG: hypothetical protein COW66_00335 [Flavobacteriaceae bacterium CG18_big_fil_WC_8_21_14_2_50_34_36]PIZ07580.1 MAG: hypothetical protein COY56_08185 [Flavobacteriaceae bacterium CG_4_10_14_0_8_um_filter_34_31]